MGNQSLVALRDRTSPSESQLHDAAVAALQTLEEQVKVWAAYRFAASLAKLDEATRQEAMRERPDEHGRFHSATRGATGRFREKLSQLETSYGAVVGWWPASEAGAEFATGATNTIEAVVWLATHLCHHITAVDPCFEVANTELAFEFLDLFCRDPAQKLLLLRAAIIREQRTALDLHEGGRLRKLADFGDPLAQIKQACFAEASRNLPRGWGALEQAEKRSRLDALQSRSEHERITHSEDYSAVAVDSVQYLFRPRQRQPVKLLIDAFRAGRRGVTSAALLEAAGGDCGRLRDLFKLSNGHEHEAWKTFIVRVAGTKDLFTIQLPPRPSR